LISTVVMFQAQNRETKLVLEKLLCPPRSLWRRAWQDCISQNKLKTCKTKTDYLVSHRSCPMTDDVRPHHWYGERCELPSWVQGGALTAYRFFTKIFSALTMASPDTIILHYCGTKIDKFLTHSIMSQLLCGDVGWCF